MKNSLEYDVVVVGASVGGCTAAILYARHGLKVALVEKSADLAHYKKLCTHYLQPAAVGTIRRLGLAALIEEAGGLRNDLEVWTEWGWIRGTDSTTPGHGYNIRRQTMDPLLRRLAVETPGVTFHPGTSVCGLLRGPHGRIAGVSVEARGGRSELSASLVVAADGKASRLAELAAVKAQVHENNRFSYFTYYRGVPLSTQATSHYWHLQPNLAYAFRNDDDTTLLGILLPKDELRAFKSDPMGNFRRFWDRVPHAPRIGTARPICELRGITEIANQWRPASAPGIAFVGDAAMVLDPIWGTGCGFAFLSADWLVEQTAPVLAAGGCGLRALDQGLERYRKQHRARTRWHYAHITSFSRVRPHSLPERLVFSAATRDVAMANRVMSYFSRTVGPLHLATLPALCRAALVNLGILDRARQFRAIWAGGRNQASDHGSALVPLVEPSGT
jgi:flavin-dependent dehydrogenase